MPKLETPRAHQHVWLRSINVVDVKSGVVIENQDVHISGNTITYIGTSKPLIKKNVLAIQGQGKYLIPGLWDMHTHSNQHSEWLHHPLYIANGVTGIRDMSGQLDKPDSYWAGSVDRLQWNSDLTQNLRVAPRYVLQSSYQMDGEASIPDGYPEYFKLQNREHVDSLLQFYSNQGVDFIKIYQQLPPDSYRALAQEAPKYGMHLAGHKPMFLTLKEAVDLGQKSFEHGRIFMFEAFSDADKLRSPKDWKSQFSTLKKSMVEDFDAEVAQDLMEQMAQKNAHWVPTLQTLKFEAQIHEPGFSDNPNTGYITKVRKKLWWDYDAKRHSQRNTQGPEAGVSHAFYEAVKKQIQMARYLGVPIMTGTDVTDSYVFAGFSLHDELMELHKSGLSNIDALRSATLVPARYAGLEAKYGSIEAGKTADLVILDANPLEQISNTQNIFGVLLNGVYYDSQKINELKDFTRNIASKFHMNVKTFHSLISSPLIRVQFAD